MWVYSSLMQKKKKKKLEGEYYTLYPHLIDDEDKFKKIFSNILIIIITIIW